ncbi:hypothetical protein ACJH6H_18500 [Mycobacterium sp. SMC-21]|jgi:hypothetical protein|uniref:DUF7882 family protein n=1 Tax=unclassified Mycobacterium TaxID=2642494 RepID=UPI00387711F6
MAKLRQGGHEVLNLVNGNYLMAHLQTAAFQKFRQGQGFFITFFGGTGNAGEPLPTSSLWCPPDTPLQFSYDAYDEPVEINAELLDRILRGMNDPIGVVVSGAGEIIWPFTVLHTERHPPAAATE